MLKSRKSLPRDHMHRHPNQPFGCATKKTRVHRGGLIDFQYYFPAPFFVTEQNVWRGPKFSLDFLDCCVWVTKTGRWGSHWKATHAVAHRSLFYFVFLGTISEFLKEAFILRALSETIQTVFNMKHWTENLCWHHSLIRHLNCWVVSLYARLNSQRHFKNNGKVKFWRLWYNHTGCFRNHQVWGSSVAVEEI